MRLGLTIDALSPQLTGIGRYTWELASRLAQHDEIKDIRYYRFDQWMADPQSYLKPKPRVLWRWPRKMRRVLVRRGFRSRLVHGTNYFLPDHAEGGVITVHDLSVLIHPDTHPLERVLQFERDFQKSLDRADHIICDSAVVRDELIAHASVNSARVSAVHLGVGPEFRPVEQAEIDAVKREILGDAAGDYILSVATLEPRKRIEQAIMAHALAWEKGRVAVPLVLVGANGWKYEGLSALIDKQRQLGRVILAGWVPDRSLPALYSGASLFLYPSIYEGFGLPPIEAMACGTPAIVSNRSCLPEVTAGAAMLIDPDDVETFALAIERAITDTSWRATAIAEGRAVASRYSWERCVDRTIEVYRGVWKGRMGLHRT